MKMDMGKCRKSMVLQLKRYPGTIKIAEAGGRPAGYISFRPKKSSLGVRGRINTVFVEGRYRKHGVGELLLKEAEKWFRSHGIKRMEAVVTNTNTRSMAFFKGQKFRERRTVLEKSC
jgi:GNAT superfamily N-acetyltransferase